VVSRLGVWPGWVSGLMVLCDYGEENVFGAVRASPRAWDVLVRSVLRVLTGAFWGFGLDVLWSLLLFIRFWYVSGRVAVSQSDRMSVCGNTCGSMIATSMFRDESKAE
jgi:hypothetical protein